MTVIKIGHNGHTRKITHEGSPPTWGWLSSKISELYRIPKDDVALSYLDSDNEQVTLSTEAELHDYFTSFMRPGEVARFTVQRVSTPAVKQVDEDGEGDHPKEASKEATPSEEWQNVETIPNDHKPDAIVYEEVWRSVDDVNGHPYIPGLDAQALNILAAIGVANHAPDLSRPVPLSPRSTATLIKVFTEKNAEDSEDEDSTTHPLPEAAEKGKNKPSQPESATPAQHVDSARSVRGSEADPAALDPPLPTTSLDTVPAPSPAPSVPNIAGDLSQMLQAITNAFTTHPELSEGVRRVIRLATDNNYLESERQRLIQTVNDAVSEATVAARNGVDDASTGLNDALQGIFDALQNGLAAASAAAAYEEGRHHRPLPSRGRWPEPPRFQPPAGPPPFRGPRGSRREHYGAPLPPAPPGPPPPPGATLPPLPGVPEQAIHIQPHFGTEALPFGGYPSRARQGSRAPSGSVPRGPAGAYPTYGAVYYTPAPEPEITVTPSAIPLTAPGAVLAQPWDPRLNTTAIPVAGATTVAAPSGREDAVRDLSDRKTALEIAKENYRREKEKWKQEKEARRRARDQEIERITGRRVLPREERKARQREQEEREEEQRRQEFERARAERDMYLTDAEVDELERNRSTRGATRTPEKVPKSPEYRGILNQTEQAFMNSPTPRPVTMTSPPPYVGARPRLSLQAERLRDQLEDMGFNAATHPRLQDIVIEKTKEAQRSDEDAIEVILAALAELAPSSSRPRESTIGI